MSVFSQSTYGRKPAIGSGYRLNPAHFINRSRYYGRHALFLFNEGGGTSLQDIYRMRAVSTWQGVDWVTDEQGYALQFNGAGDYLDLDGGDWWDFWTNDFYILCGAKTSMADIGDILRIDNGFRGLIGLRFNSGKLDFLIADYFRNVKVVSTTNTWNDGTYHTILAVRHAGYLYIYIDGAPDCTPVADSGVYIQTTCATAQVGRYGGGFDYFSGNLSFLDVGVASITPSRAAELSRAPFGTKFSPRFSYPGVRYSGLPVAGVPAPTQSLSETAQVISDSLTATLQRQLRVITISDTMLPLIDQYNPPLIDATALAGIISDRIGVPYDQALAAIVQSWAGSLSDAAQVITDAITTGKLNVSSGQTLRWIAPVSITPRNTGVDPLYLAAHPVRHPERYFVPRVKSYGTFTRAISAPVGFVKTGDGALTVYDPDNSVRQRIAAKTILNAAAEVRLGPEGGSLSAFLRPLSRIIGVVSQPVDGELSFPLKDTISDYLEQSIPNLVDANNFPSLPDGSAGEFAPIVFGRVSCRDTLQAMDGSGFMYSVISAMAQVVSRAINGPDPGGAIKAIHVLKEVDNHRYLVARHPCRSVDVWRKRSDEDGFTIVNPSEYQIVEETVASGHTCTIIQFNDDQEDAEIRCNIDGIFDEDRFTFEGFYGKAGTYITRIGMILRDSYTGEIVYSELAGYEEASGTDFEDAEIPAGAHISAILIWAGSYIDALQLEYTDGSGTITYGTKHGGAGGSAYRFEMIEGESLVSISGTWGIYIDSLTITSTLVPVAYGGTGGDMGTYQIYVDQSLGVNFADAILELLTGYIGITASLDRINLSSFEETKLKVQDLICSGAFTKPITYGEALSQIQRSSNIDLFADKNDRLTVRYTTDDEEPTVNLSDLLRLYKGTVKQQLAGPTYNQIPYRYQTNYADDTWTDETLDIEADQAAVDGVMAEEPLRLYFVRDAATALAVVEHRAQYLNLDSFRFEGEMPLVPTLESIELADIVSIDHFGGIKDGGYVQEQFKILELGMDIDSLKYRFAGIRRKLPPPSLIETTFDVNGMLAINSRVGPFYNSVEGELFAIFKDVSDPSQIRCWHTTDWGATWTTADAANQPNLGGTIASFDSYAADGKIHIATQESGSRVAYHVFDMATALWETVDEEVVASCFNSGLNCVSIETRSPGGEPVIYFQGDQQLVGGSYWNRGWYTILSGGAWSTPVMITPDPGTYAENLTSPPGLFPAGAVSSNCNIQRLVGGRENRMHFFYEVDPAVHWVRWSPDEYAVTMRDNLTVSGSVLLLSSSVHYPPDRNIGGPFAFSDRSKIAIPRKAGYGNAYAETYADEPTISLLTRQLLGSTAYDCIETGNPSGFMGEDGLGNLFCAYSLWAGSGIRQVKLFTSSGDGAAWDAGDAAGPEFPYPTILDDCYGSVIAIRGRAYLACFSDKYRWIRIDTLPYS